jgi:tetratricopeptide (TPR) repeat protein
MRYPKYLAALCILAMIGGPLLIAKPGPGEMTIWSLVDLGGVFYCKQRFVGWRAQQLHTLLVETTDPDEREAALAKLRALYAAENILPPHPMYVQLESTHLLIEERFAELRALLENVDRRNVGWPEWHIEVDVKLAAAVENEAPMEAELHAQRALDNLRGLRPNDRRRALMGSALAALGGARLEAGDPGAALGLLLQSLEHDTSRRGQQSRWFRIGLAHAALGARAEAIDAWNRASEALPNSPLGRRALEHLARMD